MAPLSIDQDEMFGYVYLKLATSWQFFSTFFAYDSTRIYGKGLSGDPGFKTKIHVGNEFFKSVLLNPNYIAVIH